jgi:hypothetical protein
MFHILVPMFQIIALMLQKQECLTNAVLDTDQII